MKKILISLLLLFTVLVSVSCCGKCEKSEIANTNTETDTVENVYLVKVLKTYVDSFPEPSYEKVDVIVNDTIRHKEIMHLEAHYGFAIEYKYCIVNEIAGTDTVWHRVMVGSDKRSFVDILKYRTDESSGYDYIVNEGDQCDEVFKITPGIRQMSLKPDSREIFIYYDNEIDSINPIIDEETREIWADARRMAKEYNSK